ncbi:hypothetical protein JTB14_029144 [Gonioctena quinquepunctata]|nr:hypothetical protein JTB14_029144 [Gonioctena quinquepunctata]
MITHLLEGEDIKVNQGISNTLANTFEEYSKKSKLGRFPTTTMLLLEVWLNLQEVIDQAEVPQQPSSLYLC